MGKFNILPYIILEDIGAMLLKRLTLQQICNIALKSRIYLSEEYFTDRAILIIKILEILISSILDISASIGA